MVEKEKMGVNWDVFMFLKDFLKYTKSNKELK